jgi:hypothetical protein
MRVLVLFVRHGTDKYRDALGELDRLYERRAPGLIRTTVVIDNAKPAGWREDLGSDRVLVGGDNKRWEFSGWQRGIETIGTDVRTYDVVHLVTSAFRTLYVDYLERFSVRIVEVVAERPVAAGHVDYYPYPVRLGTFVSRHWLRSSFCLINTSELLRLRTLVSLDDPAGLFSETGDWPFAEPAPLSHGYQKLIHQWLTTDRGTGQGTTWHSRFDLTDATRSYFQEKTVAILNEHLLSIRMRAQGTRVLDFTYLAGLLESGQTVPVHFPPWRMQLKMSKVPGRQAIADSPVL